MKKICVVTGTRAEYGLLRWVMEGIRRSKVLELQVIATGAHLSPEFGLTVNCILADGFYIDRKVEMLLSSDTPVGVCKSMGLGLIGFSDALSELRPDLMLILGDRYELLPAAASALVAGIPIAHLHGGEITEGAFDEAIRHSVTKMSHLHFVAAEEYRRRVIQLGEQPDRVFNVGGLGIDNIKRLKLLSREELEFELDFKFLARNLLITFHPVTLESESGSRAVSELLDALKRLRDVGLIFTMPNADSYGRKIFQEIQNFCRNNVNARAYVSLGQLKYLSCLQHVDGVVGNSSSGLLEAPSFRIGTVNIGDRQKGRLKAGSVIDCSPEKESIRAAIKTLFSNQFKSKLSLIKNPYGSGGASEAVVSTLEVVSFGDLLKKQFYDLSTPT